MHKYTIIMNELILIDIVQSEMIPEVEADPGGQSEQERLTLLYVWLPVQEEDGENSIWLDSRQ